MRFHTIIDIFLGLFESKHSLRPEKGIQNEKTNKKGISRKTRGGIPLCENPNKRPAKSPEFSEKTRLYGGLGSIAVDSAKLQHYRPNNRKKTTEHHIYYDGRPRLARPELLRKQNQPNTKPRPARQRGHALQQQFLH